MTLQPLAGLRVLDFTAYPPGAICTVLLADLGAEIIRVEPPALKGKPSLVFGQLPMSRGKSSLTLDMRNPAAKEVLTRLAPSIDVVIENARPGSMEERGFGYSQARAANPKIIWCAITGFGQAGPYADYSGHDISYLAHSGLLAAMSPDPGFQPGLQLAVPVGAMAAVVGIQSALLLAARTGEGSFVDISLSEAASWVLTGGIDALSDRPFMLPPSADRRRYMCADGRQVAIACSEPRTWAALCDGLGLPGLIESLHKPDHAEEAARQIAAAFLTGPAPEWVERLAPAGAAVTIVNHGSQLAADPQARARGTVMDCGGVPVPANPVRVTSPDGASTGTGAQVPHKVGQDSAEVLAAAGFSPAEIEALTMSGIV